MRFDPSKWTEVPIGSTFRHSSQRVHVRASREVAVYVTDRNGMQALAGTGFEVNVLAQGVFEVSVEQPGTADCRVFIYDPASQLVPLGGPSLTNTDRQPHESGNMAALLHRVRLEERAMVQRMRQREKAMSERGVKPAPEPEPEPQPASEPEPDPAPVE